MDGPGDQFLAGSGFAEDQHAARVGAASRVSRYTSRMAGLAPTISGSGASSLGGIAVLA